MSLFEWQKMLQDLAEAPNVGFQDVLDEFDELAWYVKGLIITRSNLEVTWKIRPQMYHYLIPL